MLKPPFIALPLVQDNKVTPLAVTGSNRSLLLPDVPTVAEAGYEKFEAGYWGGFFAPTGTPPVVIKKLNTEIVASIKDKRVAERLLKTGVEVIGNSPEQFRQELDSEIELWRKVINKSGIQPQ